MVKRIITIVGARPQFIKASVVSLAISKQPGLEEIIVHTGQHFDVNMSDVFFEDLGIPKPKYQLDIHGGSHGQMTGRMLEEIEKTLVAEMPDRVLVYGDTNSTLAGALAAAKLHIPVAHIEAGLRSFDRKMPEEINRVLSDQISDILFCPTDTAIRNLANEGFSKDRQKHILKVGDVMEDATRIFAAQAKSLAGIDLQGEFILATLHRAENTDNVQRLTQIVTGLNDLHQKYPVVLPLHPRTRNSIEHAGLSLNVHVVDPASYFEMLWLLNRCVLVATDSGGVQKEAFFHGKQCITMRDTTEWTELIDLDVNVLVGADAELICAEALNRVGQTAQNDGSLYGGGTAAEMIAAELMGT